MKNAFEQVEEVEKHLQERVATIVQNPAVDKISHNGETVGPEVYMKWLKEDLVVID